MSRFQPVRVALAWLCRRPWEAAAVALALFRAQYIALRRGGRVRVLARAGGLGDVLWAAAAADVATKQSPQDVLLFLTQKPMREAARLAAPGMPLLATHLPNPHMQSLLRRLFEVMELTYETADTTGRHMVLSYLQQLGCPQEAAGVRWHFRQVPDVRARQPLACIYTGPSWAVRELPPETWSAVVRHLQQESGLRVLQILPDEHSTAKVPGCDGYVIGETLSAICNLFDQSALVLTIDSVMLHLAAGTRAPLVGVFGPTLASARLFETPRRQAVSADVACAGCHHRQPRLHWEGGCPHDIECMKQVSPSMLLEAATRVRASVDPAR